MREKQPRLLVIWGKYDLSFDLSEPEAYRHDVPNAQVHLLDAGHFALDTAADEIAELVRGFVASPRAPSAGAAGERRPRTIKIARSPRTLESRPELRSDVRVHDQRHWRSSVRYFYGPHWESLSCLPSRTALASGAPMARRTCRGAITPDSWTIRPSSIGFCRRP